MFAEMLRRAKALKADVLCLQEHKWRPGKNLEMARACARVADFELYVQPDEGPRGGAAILVPAGDRRP